MAGTIQSRTTMRIYTIYDRIAEESGPLFEAKNDGVAARKMRDFAKTNPINPNEYKLLCLGEVDHENNFLVPLNGKFNREVEWSVVPLSQAEEQGNE